MHMLPVAHQGKSSNGAKYFYFYFYFMTCRAILHNSSQKKQTDTLNSIHEN